jgi:hypothetical protein
MLNFWFLHTARGSVLEPEPKLSAGAGVIIKFQLRLQVRHRNPYLNFYLTRETYMNNILIVKFTNLPKCLISQ